MNFPEDHIACEQARVLGGLEHRHPEDNFSFEMFNKIPLLELARGLGSLRRSIAGSQPSAAIAGAVQSGSSSKTISKKPRAVSIRAIA